MPQTEPNQTSPTLARTLWDCFGKTGSMVDLDEAISMSREVLSLCPPGHPHRLLPLENFIEILEARFKENGDQSDFEEAASLRQEILAMSK